MKVSNEGKINYNNIVQPNAVFGIPIGRNQYKFDEEGNIKSYPDGLINAIDINWGGAEVKNSQINTTDDLLDLINGLGSGGSSDTPIDSNQIIPIMLSAIRALQAEVIKLRNSFKNGIVSYKDEKTKMSNVLHEYHDIEAEEPLWATDESELSGIEGYNFEDPRQFSFTGDDILNGEDNEEYVKITGEGIWEDTSDKLKDVEDPRVYCYLTVDSLDFTIKLKTVNYSSENILDTENISYKDIDFSKFNIRESINGVYNILIILGRKQYNSKDKKLYGENFIWIGIADYLTSEMKLNGYLNLSNEITPSPFYVNERYIFNKITFNDITLSKLDFYSKYNDFTNEVQESTVSDDPYKYEAAHITIRSVKKYETLESIKNQLLDDELIYVKESGKLYIISDNTIKNISVGSGDDTNPTDPDNMTNEQLLAKLEELGIIIIEKDENGSILSTSLNNDIILNNFESVKFINTETNQEFNITVDAYGNFVSSKNEPEKSLEFNINKATEDNINKLLKGTNRVFYDNGIESSTNGFIDVRGFVSRYNDLNKNGSLSNITNATTHKMGSSWKLNADRIKIASIYAPLSSDTKISCTHAYVELENTSNEDFPLDGCYLHFDRPVINKSTNEIEYIVSHLALKGYIPANSTYLIRGKKYRDNNDANIFVKVNTFDQEWYDKETNNDLIDFTLYNAEEVDNEGKKIYGYGFALTYQEENLTHETELATANSSNLAINGHNAVLKGLTETDFPFLYKWNFIDAVCINKQNKWLPDSSAGGIYVAASNSIYKNMFELDPAKQAFNSLNKKDSSRSRYQKSETDLQTLELSDGYISFPKTLEYKKYVSDYTPKASFEHKNVQTDKTKLNVTKPNAVTVSFGTNVFTTRCFNWVSAGLFDEYVFVKKVGDTEWNVFESYKNTSISKTSQYTYTANENEYPKLREYPENIKNTIYASLTKERIYDYFPADGTYYTSHKCIINICASAPSSPEEWVYVIGRGIKDENDKIIGFDPNYHSEEMHFTMYPSSYVPKIYQVTDQQGFHWQEYQAWAAVAKGLNEKIYEECNNKQIIPILINTGDMTQSGARVSEWLDYYNAGECLFNHLEQMNIVGNNDLSPVSSVNDIGMGDDVDKSNPYFYNLFYCYEVNPIYLNTYYTSDDDIPEGKHVGDIKGQDMENPIYPIVNNVYIPSLYYIDINNLRLLFLNSEITQDACDKWFKTVKDEKICNIYTGYLTTQSQMTDEASPYLANQIGFTTIYTMIYHMTEDTSKKYIAICHEMPFTVITKDSLYYEYKKDEQTTLTSIGEYRSISSANALVGCHMNQVSKGDFGYGIYWFSRLMEYRNIKLVLGGHKHTYCVTYPLAENYKYGDDKWSLIDGCMAMSETLNNDLERSVKWTWTGENIGDSNTTIPYEANHTKLPLTLVSDDELATRYNNNCNDQFIINKALSGKNENAPIFLPCHIISDNWINGKHYTQEEADNYNTEHGLHNGDEGFVTTDSWQIAKHNIHPVRYFMCQASGYKLTSNKELPSALQRFSELIPQTTIKADKTDKPNNNQQSPMYATISFDNSLTNYSIKLTRVRNISKDNLTGDPAAWLFNQQSHSTDPMRLEYITLNRDSFNSDKYNFGAWSETESNLYDNISL